jgi:hypothetical protein
VQRDYPDDSDPFVYMAWLAAAYLAGATHAKDGVPLSKELRRALAYLDARRKSRGHSDSFDELRLRREHRGSLRWMASLNSAEGFWAVPIILLGRTFDDFAERFCRFSVSSVWLKLLDTPQGVDAWRVAASCAEIRFGTWCG